MRSGIDRVGLSYGLRGKAREFVVTGVGQGHPRLYFSCFSFLCFPFSFVHSLRRQWRGGDRDAPLGRYGNLWDAAGEWTSGSKLDLNHRQLP